MNSVQIGEEVGERQGLMNPQTSDKRKGSEDLKTKRRVKGNLKN